MERRNIEMWNLENVVRRNNEQGICLTWKEKKKKNGEKENTEM
jgi:hypothetical protein